MLSLDLPIQIMNNFYLVEEKENYSGQWEKNDSSKALIFSATESTDTNLCCGLQ